MADLDKMETIYRQLDAAGLLTVETPPALALIAGFLIGQHARQKGTNPIGGYEPVERVMKTGVLAGMVGGTFDELITVYKATREKQEEGENHEDTG